jgi:hypothetical protein
MRRIILFSMLAVLLLPGPHSGQTTRCRPGTGMT